MAPSTTSEPPVTSLRLRLTSPRDEAIAAVRAALPDDAVVREEEDGVGRFAGVRTLMMIGTGHRRLMLFEGTWGSLKGRLERPQVDVEFEGDDDAPTVTIAVEAETPPTIMTRFWDLVGSIITVAAVVVAYHMVRKIPYDLQQVALIAVAGGVVWTVVSMLMPKKQDRKLHTLVRNALLSLAADDDDHDPSRDTAVSDESPPEDADVRETHAGDERDG